MSQTTINACWTVRTAVLDAHYAKTGERIPSTASAQVTLVTAEDRARYVALGKPKRADLPPRGIEAPTLDEVLSYLEESARVEVREREERVARRLALARDPNTPSADIVTLAWGDAQACPDAAREIEAAIKAAKVREAEAAKARRDRQLARVAWAAEHGSARLKLALSRGYDCRQLYLTERAAHELGIGAAADLEDALDLRPRSNPSMNALATETQWLAVAAQRAWGPLDEGDGPTIYVAHEDGEQFEVVACRPPWSEGARVYVEVIS